MPNIKNFREAAKALHLCVPAKIGRCIAEFQAAAWDRRIERNATSGKLDHLAFEAYADFHSKGTRETLAALFENLADGATVNDVAAWLGRVEQLRAALAHAAASCEDASTTGEA